MRVLFEIFGQTLRTLWAHKLRSFLTMFGIAWGVGSLLLLVGLGRRVSARATGSSSTELGENVMFIWGGRAPAVEGSFTSMRQYYLTYKDYLDILRECPDVKAAVPVISRQDIRAVSDFFQSSGQLMGVPADFNRDPLHADPRRPLAERSGRRAEAGRVIVLGDEARRFLFPGRPSVGSTILLNGIRFEVIGTLKRIGHGDNNTVNLRIFIPFNTMQQYFPPTKSGGAGRHLVHQLSAEDRARCMKRRSWKCTRSSPAITASITAIRMRSTNGTRSAPSTRWARFSTP